jgi:hypothetical protein
LLAFVVALPPRAAWSAACSHPRLADDRAELTPQILGDEFWKKRGLPLRVDLSALNSCHESNVIPLTIGR